MENQRRVAVYVDGFNLYHAIDELNVPKLKWLNLDALARSLLRPQETLVKCHYFTSIVDWNPKKEANHRAYIAAQRAQGVTITYGTFKTSKKHCAQFSRQLVHKLRPNIQLTWAAPPNRMRNAREIGKIVKDRIEIKAGRLAACRLPQVIQDHQQKVIARIPPAYL